MKESTLDITKYLRTGLRISEHNQLNKAGLEVATNVVLDRNGLQAFVDITDPFSGNESPSHPFPQIFRGEGGTFLFYQTTVESVVEGSPWVGTPITTIGIDNVGTATAITGNGAWHFSDLRKSWYAFNGTCVVFQTGLDSLYGRTVDTYVQSDVTVNTGCTHQGRVILAGFDSSNVWPTIWNVFFEEWKKDRPGAIRASNNDVGSAYIFWSGIGAGDFPLWLFFPKRWSSELNPTEARVIERARENQFGFMPMPFQGPIHVVKPLGDRLVVYAADGVAILKPYANDFASGYGVESSVRVGSYSRGAVSGDDEQHIFVTPSGEVWSVTEEGISRVGFSEFLYDELDTNLRLSFDPYRKFHYISGDNGYVLSREGLTKTTQRTASVDFVEGGVVGAPTDSAEDDADYIYITTSPLDFGLRSIKTLTGITLGIESDFDVSVSVYFRYEKDTAWSQSSWYSLNREGNTFLRIAAVEFKIAIKILGKTDVQVHYGSVHWQSSDKRFIRGFSQTPKFDEDR